MNYELILAWFLDFIFGDPIRLPHPIVYFGKWISFGEHRLNKNTHRKTKGALFAVSSVLLVFFVAYLIFYALDNVQTLPFTLYPLHFALSVLLIFFCLAGHTLRKEVKMVFEAVDISLEAGRKQVARIVGRDTQDLSAQEVRTAALETLAENLSDGVIAPLFWYALLGVPGMLAYKMINTLDSMIGYQNARYKDFGCWAAHIDDIANYIPARLTALMMIIFASLRHPKSIIHYSLFTIHYSKMHASPNSGWPESALAAILNCRFGGPHNYFGEIFYKPYIGENDRPLTTLDMKISIHICLIVEVISIMLISISSIML